MSEVSEKLEEVKEAVIEIAADVMLETTGKVPDAEPRESMDRSAEYWIGWAAAYYQWYSSRSYAEIFRALPFDDLRIMYRTLHEADVSKFAEIADERIREYFRDTNLKRIRTVYGLTQAALVERSGVTLRSIQMYEERHKDINKASAVPHRKSAGLHRRGSDREIRIPGRQRFRSGAKLNGPAVREQKPCP